MAKPPNQHFGVVEDIINKLLRVKAITFDIDGTIWDFVGAMRHSLFKALHEAHLRDPETASMLDVDIMIETRDLVHLAMREITPDLVEIRKASFRQALIDIGRPNELLAERMSEVYFDNRWAKSDLYEDVRPAMETLATKYHLGVISNGNSYPERFGLTDLISSCVYAQDHGGVNKPDPKLFQIAIDEAACNPHELLHVGDSLSSDVGGAKNFGALAAWINRDGAKSSAKYKPDLEIVSLSELVEIL